MPQDRYGSISSSTIGTIGRRTNDPSDSTHSNHPNGSTNSLDLDTSGDLAEAKYDLSTEDANSGVAEIAAINGSHDLSDENMENPPHPINPLGLYLLSDPNRGRGVFTKSFISAGTLLEESPVLVMSKEEWEEGRMNDTILGEYGFCWAQRGMAIGLGLASLFNHSSSPNVNFIRNTKARTIAFRTVKNINPGEELCICYAADESKLWFVDSTKAKPGNDGDNNVGESSPEMETFPLVDPDDLYDATELAERRAHRKSRLKNDVSIRDMRTFVAPDEEPFATQPSMRLGESQLGKPPVVSTRPFTPEPEDAVIHSPRPVRFQGYPSPPYHDNLPDVVSDGPLPPPLHSTPTPSPNTPPDLGVAELVEELDWRAEDWSKKNNMETDIADDCVRIKGPAEIEDDELFHDGLMDVWVVDVWEPQLTKEVLAFSKEMGFNEQAMKHLKRVTRRPNPDGEGEYTCIALCSEHRYNGEQLIKLMSCFHPTLAELIPRVQPVPKTVARNAEEARIKNQIWPVNLSPLQHKPASSSHWSPARRAWVNAGIQRILSIALEAKQRGEVPVGVFCASAPEMFWPSHDGFIAPTPDLRAQSSDTRITACHPLRHAVLNCVRAVAHLRTVPPFSTLIPTRNGADYLLTSLTLFITHEPCSMCCMALLHSRVREVFYIFPRKKGGGFEEGGLGIHGRKDLNHRFEVWKYTGEIDQAIKEALEIDDGIAV